MTKQLFLQKLGSQIRKLRMEKNLSQIQLAHRCGKDAQSLERVENGKINASSFYLLQISEGLEVEVGSFFCFTDN